MGRARKPQASNLKPQGNSKSQAPRNSQIYPDCASRHQIANGRGTADAVSVVAPARLSRVAGAGVALRSSGDEVGGDDEFAEGAAGQASAQLFAPRARPCAKTGLRGHDAEVFMAIGRSFVDRKRPHPRQSRAIRRAERPPYALRLDASR